MSPEEILSLHVAVVRYAAKSRQWVETGGAPPRLAGFLCGWFARILWNDTPPDPDAYRDSFRAGWDEADTMVRIKSKYKR